MTNDAATILRFPEREQRLDTSRWGVGPDFSARIEGNACYATMNHVGDRASVTPGLLRGMRAYGDALQSLHDLFRGPDAPLRYLVLGAEPSGTFNLGGDLALFHDCLTRGDREGLTAYGHACIDVIHRHHRRYGLPVITIAVVQGEALGGGFETVLAHDIVVAEEDARFGLPEVMFNLFPGMGAYSFLSRRVGPAKATELILGGRIHTAREMQALGLVHHVVPNGTGYEALRGILRDVDRRFAAYRAVLDLDRRIWPVTHEELVAVVDVWVETAFQLNPIDLRMMQKIVHRQLARSA
jgi:DSF synthase